jgi:hypothetical protein
VVLLRVVMDKINIVLRHNAVRRRGRQRTDVVLVQRQAVVWYDCAKEVLLILGKVEVTTKGQHHESRK